MVEKENDIVVAAVPTALAQTENNAAADAAINLSASPSNKSHLKVLAYYFFKAYYTKLSDQPNDIGTFYGEDSILVQEDVEEIGRENIQNAIGAMNFGGCKSRFYSLKATPAIGDSKVFQVCGELTLKGQAAPRRFSQTIVLSCAPPNVLYVKSNIFQWLDTIFPVNGTEKSNFISTPSLYSRQPVENGNGPPMATNAEKPLLNGNNHIDVGQSPTATIPSEKEPTVMITGGPPPGLEKNGPPQQITQMAIKVTPEKMQNLSNGIGEENSTMNEIGKNNRVDTFEQQEGKEVKEKEEPNKDIIKADNTKTEEIEREHSTEPTEAEQQPKQKYQPKTTEPKSWNKVVSGGQNKTQPQQNNKMMIAPKQQQRFGGMAQMNYTQQQMKKTQPLYSDEQANQQSKGNTPTPPPLPHVEHHNQQRQFHTSSPNNENIVKPREEWPFRIYFNNLDKPKKFVNNKVGQQELKKELMNITQGVEFVAIKPLSLRAGYHFAFGFIDFTTAEDMQAVYKAAQKNRLKVSIPHFEFDGYLTLASDKTNNLGGIMGGDGNSYGQSNFQGRQQYHRNNNNNGGGGMRNNKMMASTTKSST